MNLPSLTETSLPPKPSDLAEQSVDLPIEPAEPRVPVASFICSSGPLRPGELAEPDRDEPAGEQAGQLGLQAEPEVVEPKGCSASSTYAEITGLFDMASSTQSLVENHVRRTSCT